MCTMCALLLVVPARSADRVGVDRRSAGTEAGQEEPRRVRARVWPMFAQAPAIVRIEVLVEPDEENRALEIVADSGDYFRSSSIPLEGVRAARFHAVEYRSMPAGRYFIDVELRGRSGAVQAADRRQLEVRP